MDKVIKALIRIEEAREIARRLEEKGNLIKVTPIEAPVILRDGEGFVINWIMTSKEG